MIAKVGMSVNMTCGVQTADVLEVFFKWEKNYVNLMEDKRVFTTKEGTHTSVLHLKNLRMTDLAVYGCIAMTTGRVGSRDSANAYLTVTGQCFYYSAKLNMFLSQRGPRLLYIERWEDRTQSLERWEDRI